MADKRDIFERNMLAISTKDPNLSSRIRLISQSDTAKISFSEARSGKIIPVYKNAGHIYPLHSRFDPEREGEKIASNFQQNGTLFFLGLGGGYHIEPFLHSSGIASIIVIEKELNHFVEIIKHIDLKDLFLDKRVSLIVGKSAEEIEQEIISFYLPVITGDLQTIPLNSLVQLEKDYYEQVIKSMRSAAEKVKEDYSVQCYFGKRWFNNTIQNLQAAERSSAVLPPVKKVFITAAGPSLEMQIEEIKKSRSLGFLIATDTSLPMLLKSGIKPDLVISIDCQHISYHHFISGYPEDIPLMLDLASPPLLTRMTEKLLFFTSGHPLSNYINNHFRKFPEIDTSGGNVTHAAVSLAASLRAESITLFGADFSYPQGKAYARGTYIYPYFSTLESRTAPLCSQMAHFIFRNPVETICEDNMIKYVSAPMSRYKKYLEEKSGELTSPIKTARGMGLDLQLKPARTQDRGSIIVPFFGSGSSHGPAVMFLEEFLNNIRNLPPIIQPLVYYFDNLKIEDKQVWSTLLPAASQFMRMTNNSISALQKSLDWSIKKVEKVLQIKNSI